MGKLTNLYKAAVKYLALGLAVVKFEGVVCADMTWGFFAKRYGITDNVSSLKEFISKITIHDNSPIILEFSSQDEPLNVIRKNEHSLKISACDVEYNE